MLPQPPPDVQAPMPSEHAIRSHRKWRWLWISGVISLILLAIFMAPMMIHVDKCADEAEAVNNARQIGMVLWEFETKYGTFPDDSTISAVRNETLTDLDLGTKSSNDYFRQLLASGMSLSETQFFANINGSRKPDGVFTKGEALKARECGFTYFLGAKAKDNSRRPLVATPMIPGTDRFDLRKHFHGKAVVLHCDLSVKSYPIDKSGHVLIDGRNMMDPHHPIWDGHAPTIAWPEL